MASLGAFFVSERGAMVKREIVIRLFGRRLRLAFALMRETNPCYWPRPRQRKYAEMIDVAGAMIGSDFERPKLGRVEAARRLFRRRGIRDPENEHLDLAQSFVEIAFWDYGAGYIK